ncbi:MAG TPA: SpoIIE family protein phosphatase [Candidatus Acidoferrum sp.]
MDQKPQPVPFSLVGDADPAAPALFASQPEQAQGLTLLYEVSHELTSILDRAELLRRIAERIKKLVNYHVFSVMLWNEAEQALESVFAMRYEDAIPSRVRMPLHQGITGTAAAERRTIRVDDVRQDPRYQPCDETDEVRSELVVPLLLQGRLIGVLDLESTEPNAFTAEHERLLNILGSYIAVALENARLFEQARDNQTRLQDDLETAREIQRQLLPTGAREVPGLDLATAYVPARELGGDFYDLLPYGVGRLAISIGDVSGKGTAAALYGSLAIGIQRELVNDREAGPAEMLQLLNVRLLAARLDARFIAMHFAVYDAALRELSIANAGGTLPLMVRNGEVTEVQVSGMPLGLLPEAEYEEVTLALLPGDIVVFASDGIHESTNARQEEFGTDRLKELLARVSAHDAGYKIAQRIVKATDEHAGVGRPPHDDRTLLVLRFTDDAGADFSKLPIIY